jgi:hypothetical protein
VWQGALMAEEFDYYALLGVPPDASEALIRLAFRRLARLYHPDVAGTGNLVRMQQLNAAYRTLSDPERRRAYDATREPVPHAAATPPREPPSTYPAPAPAPQRPRRAGTIRHTAGPFQHVHTLQTSDTTPVAALALARDGAVAGVGLLDGRVTIWDVPAARLITTLSFQSKSAAGVLQELRLSPSGTLAMAWGFQLGLRVWQVRDGRGLWTTGTNAPAGMMDAVLFDEPPRVRLALPDAPLALADEDPFRWAHEGRAGTAILSRPLRGQISPGAAVPVRCAETSGGLFGDPPDPQWRVHQRQLAHDGHALLTFSTGRVARIPMARVFHLWELDRRTVTGASQPRRIARVAQSADDLQFPIAATPDLAWAAATSPHGAVHVFAVHGREQRTIPTGAVAAEARLTLAPDASYLAVARDTVLDLWRTTDGQRAAQWEFATEITAVVFARTGTRVLLGIGLRNGLVELWA